MLGLLGCNPIMNQETSVLTGKGDTNIEDCLCNCLKCSSGFWLILISVHRMVAINFKYVKVQHISSSWMIINLSI